MLPHSTRPYRPSQVDFSICHTLLYAFDCLDYVEYHVILRPLMLYPTHARQRTYKVPIRHTRRRIFVLQLYCHDCPSSIWTVVLPCPVGRWIRLYRRVGIEQSVVVTRIAVVDVHVPEEVVYGTIVLDLIPGLEVGETKNDG